MNLPKEKAAFDRSVGKRVYESALLTFHGTEGYDVYNPSIPFWIGGHRYLFGRVEKRGKWASSVVRLFREAGPDLWELVREADNFPLEDPFVSAAEGALLLGGTHVKKVFDRISGYNTYFYRGDARAFSQGAPEGVLVFETCGPDNMKDIRLVELSDGRLGVFSRPRRRFADGAEARIGFAVIDSFSDLTPEVVDNAPFIEGLFGAGQWGGVNQAYLLPDGKIGVIGHASFLEMREGEELQVYCNTSFVLDPETRKAEEYAVIGTAAAYPGGPAKLPRLIDCVFTSGIYLREDGRADLYSGVRDVASGRIVIDYPFAGHGAIRNIGF